MDLQKIDTTEMHQIGMTPTQKNPSKMQFHSQMSHLAAKRLHSPAQKFQTTVESSPLFQPTAKKTYLGQLKQQTFSMPVNDPERLSVEQVWNFKFF